MGGNQSHLLSDKEADNQIKSLSFQEIDNLIFNCPKNKLEYNLANNQGYFTNNIVDNIDKFLPHAIRLLHT